MREYATYLVKVNRLVAALVAPDSLAELRGDEVFVESGRLGRLPHYPRQLIKDGVWSVIDLRVVSTEDRPRATCVIAKEE